MAPRRPFRRGGYAVTNPSVRTRISTCKQTLQKKMGLGMGLGRGLGRCASYGVFKSEAQAIITGVAGICGTGGLLTLSWFAYIADRKPRTFSPGWQKATQKYRAAQNQDPIANM